MSQLAELLKQQAQCVCTLKQPAQQAASAKGFERLLTASILSPGATGECSVQDRIRMPVYMTMVILQGVALHALHADHWHIVRINWLCSRLLGKVRCLTCCCWAHCYSPGSWSMFMFNSMAASRKALKETTRTQHSGVVSAACVTIWVVMDEATSEVAGLQRTLSICVLACCSFDW